MVVGGGAAGFFAAINIAEKAKHTRVTILEKSSKLLEKVRISGGGRCNVTHACFEPKELVRFYPRGERELLGAFLQFNPTHTIQWFKNRGVQLKREDDGRMFPTTDSSETIVQCFIQSALKAGIEVCINEGLDQLSFDKEKKTWNVTTGKSRNIQASAVVVCTGSAVRTWQLLANLGHNIVPAVPSLFTFNIKDERINNLAGVSLKNAVVGINSLKLKESGPLLITHWGFSGPAVLRLSAWGARKLCEAGYRFTLAVDFSGLGMETVLHSLNSFKLANQKKSIIAHPLFGISERLWKQILPKQANGKKWADVSKKLLQQIAESIAKAQFEVSGKSTFKDEFVTAGGVNLKEVDFKTMQSKLYPNLFFAGEVLDIDAITGGFNFQAAWTTSWIASNFISGIE